MRLKENQEIRKMDIEGVDTLVWLKGDTGAFGSETDGPLFDWIEGKSHFLKYAKQFDTVVQAGGCCGMYPRFYSNYFKKVYTFEPDPNNFSCLDLNCIGEQFYKYNKGLSNTIRAGYLSNESRSNVGTHKVHENGEAIELITIDSLNLNCCDLIHLDVEGHETEVLEGAIETIKKFKPVIIVERNSGQKLLEELGYHRAHKLRMDSIFIL